MNKIVGIAVLIFIAFAGWQIGESLSKDAAGMALGVIFGMMAGIPAALIALSAPKRPERIDIYHHHATAAPPPQKQLQQQPQYWIVKMPVREKLVVTR